MEKRDWIFGLRAVAGARLLCVLVISAFALALHADTEIVDGIEWDYDEWSSGVTVNGVVGVASGAIAIPSSLGGAPVTEIRWNAFKGCAGLTSVTIPEGVANIGNGAFEDCTGLKSIAIPGSVEEIGWGAFQGCSGLKFATLATGVRKIGNDAFADCTGLTSLSLPPTVTEIGWDAFSGCAALSSISIPKGLASIGDYAFQNCSGLKSVSIPKGVTSIGDGAFQGCATLVAVSIPDGVTRIGNSAFEECSSLASVAIPSTVTSLGTAVFLKCKNLKSVTIPNSVTSVGMHAFFWCDGLKTLVIPKRFKGRTDDWAIPSGCTICYLLTSGSSYKVAFDANGGKLPKGKKMAAQTTTYGKTSKLRKNVFTRKGCVFIGWAKSKKGAVAYANAQVVKNITDRSGTVTLYAKWAKKTYKVKFYANGGKGKMAVETFTYGKAKKLTANKFKAPKGKKFAGWATSKANAKKGKVAYKNKKAVKNLVTNGKTVKLYAVWKKK